MELSKMNQLESVFAAYYEADAELKALQDSKKEIELEEIETDTFLRNGMTIKDLQKENSTIKKEGIKKATESEDHKALRKALIEATKKLMEKKEKLLIS